jgi:single-strand DNA-binding protein
MLVITAHGNLGRDPELKDVGSSQVANFTIATTTGKDETTWINCQVWGKRSEVVMKYFTKGSKVTVSGRGKLRSYTKNDGTQGQSLELDVQDFSLPARQQEEAAF